MKILQQIFAIAIAVSFPACATEAIKMNIVWSEGQDEISAQLKQGAQIEDAVRFLNQSFNLQRSITLQFGAEDGPLYDPQADEILIPYEFYKQVVGLFSELHPDEEAHQQQSAMDSVLHTLFHEFGHAAIDQFSIPVLGREEDAADALASVLLIEYYEDGTEMALNAAELFALESEQRGALQEQDYWDEHSLDEQRYYSTVCHVVGSDTEQYSELAETVGFSAERVESCEFEYQQLVTDWEFLLEPAFK